MYDLIDDPSSHSILHCDYYHKSRIVNQPVEINNPVKFAGPLIANANIDELFKIVDDQKVLYFWIIKNTNSPNVAVLA
jgi:hypothetical protein